MSIRKVSVAPSIAETKSASSGRRVLKVAFWVNRQSIDFNQHTVSPERGLILFFRSKGPPTQDTAEHAESSLCDNLSRVVVA
ncbi:MAG: hypothetical protein OSA42_06205 [Porticoccaceae bacterium]|nr:hypothetical protein [Porticoccaceae bacterium]